MATKRSPRRNQLLGNRIRRLRKRSDLTQEKLAEKVRMTTTEIGYIEIGKHFPKPENLQKIANALNVKVRDLFPF